MTRPLRWGILGTGNIARQFAAGVAASRRGQLAAVGSRTLDTARAFAAAQRIATAHASYDAVIADAAVDAVYIALPNSLHHTWAIEALRAGKHVLCEKPIALDARQAEEMFDQARRSGRVLMEAFMYRTHPLMKQVIQAVDAGRIGSVRLLRSSFCFRVRTTEGNIRFDPALGGGALMDIGCYCVNFSRLFAKAEPTAIHVTARMHPSGVDEIVTGTLRFPNDVLATFTCGMTVQADNSAYICGADGYVEIPVPWKPPAQGAVFAISGNAPARMDSPGPAGATPASPSPAAPPREEHRVNAGIDLYGMEADAFAAIALAGEPPAIPPADTLGNMRVLDEMRRQLRTI